MSRVKLRISNPTATSKVPSADQVEPAVSLTVESKILTISSPVPTIFLDISPDTSSGSRLISKGAFSQKEAPSLGNALTLSNSRISNPTATSKVPSADQVEPAVSLTVESKILTISSPVPTIFLDISPDTSSGSRLISKGAFSQKEAPSLGNALTLSNRFEDTIGNTTNAVGEIVV
nr:hypothetical protein [Tanacetum cinerariifolium]